MLSNIPLLLPFADNHGLLNSSMINGYEKLEAAIDRVNGWHGDTSWTLHSYRMDRGGDMATIARKPVFRDRV